MLDIGMTKSIYGHFTSSVLARLVHCEMLHGRSSRSQVVPKWHDIVCFAIHTLWEDQPSTNVNSTVSMNEFKIYNLYTIAIFYPRQSPLLDHMALAVYV